MSEQILNWLEPCSTQEKIKAIALMYARLTVCTRELFLPDAPKGRETLFLKVLHGINELHHTLSNQLNLYLTNDKEAYSVELFGELLLDVAARCPADARESVRKYLMWSAESARKSMR